MSYVTFSEASRFLNSAGVRIAHLQNMCDCKQLYSVVVEGMRVIPYDSFLRFLQYNSSFRDAFDTYYEYERDENMKRKKDELLEYFSKAPHVCDEEYTLEQLSNIFDISISEIKKQIRKEKKIRLFMPKKIPVTKILIYLRNNPNAFLELQERHDMLLAIGSIYESDARHILMLHSYYQGYGYII